MSFPMYHPNITAPTQGTPVVFQAPHQQPETMIDLFDDTAPSTLFSKTPMLKTPLLKTPLLQTPVGSWKPVTQTAVQPSEADLLT